MTCVTKIYHKKCDKDNLQVFYNENTDSYSGYCFVCGEYEKTPYPKGDKPKVAVKSPEEVFQEVQEIKELYACPKFRGIPSAFYKRFGVRQALSEYDGKTPYAVYYPYTSKGKLVGWKARLLHRKAFWSVGQTKGCDPFNFNNAIKVGSRRVYICEGEQDAIALDYILTLNDQKTKFKGRRYSIVSVPDGTSSIVRAVNILQDHFEEIVLLMDNDDAGKEAIVKALKVNPDILMVTIHPEFSDVSDVVLKGTEADMSVLAKDCLFNAKKPPIKGVVEVMDVIDRATEPPVWGLAYPWSGLTELTYGQRFSEAVAIGSGTGLGKTVIAHELCAWNAKEHNEGTFMVMLEEQNVDTLRNVVGKINSIPYHVPGLEYDKELLRDTASDIQGKLIMWDDTGCQNRRFDIEEILKAIRFNTLERGIRFHTIDNATRLVDHLSASEANEFLNRYSSEIENMCNQLDIHIDMYSHVNAPKFGPSHEEGSQVYPNQFTGSKGMMRSFPMMLSFERNKFSKETKSNSYVRVIKNRKYGNEDVIKTQYSPTTGRLIQNEWEGDTLITEKPKKGY